MDPQIIEAQSPLPGTVPAPAQAEVDEVLRKKRKAREHKACYPCRQRKVKCDLTRPCKTCRDREHPNLCSYHPPNKRQELEYQEALTGVADDARAAGIVTLARGDFDALCRKLDGLENSIAELRREIRLNNGVDTRADHRPLGKSSSRADGTDPLARSHTDKHGLHTKTGSGEYVHFGGGSIPALLFSLGQDTRGPQQTPLEDYLGKTVLPLFGLENESVVYPFVDLWGLPHGSLQRAHQLAKALPSNEQILTLYESYRDVSEIIYPGVPDLAEFERDLRTFLTERSAHLAAGTGVDQDTAYGKSYHWLGLLFAVLASGAQSSVNKPRNERELTSRVYVCCSFECLRFTNFLSQPQLEDIQSLLIMGMVLSNNINPGTAWSLLGLTVRLAQGLGIHTACRPHVAAERIYPRSRTWWALIWQDTLLSLSYDRKATLDVHTMSMPQYFGAVRDYHASMYRLSKVAADIIRDRAHSFGPREQIDRINAHRDEIQKIIAEAAPHLRDSRKCDDLRQTIEHWGLYMHTSYVMSELCRPAMNRASNSELSQRFKRLCIDSLVDTLEAYLGLNNVTFYARQSWGAIHRGLSSALLLGILGEHERNERAKGLIGRFIQLMSELIEGNEQHDVSLPIQRGIIALRRLNIDGFRDLPRLETAAPLSLRAVLAPDVGSDGTFHADGVTGQTPSARSDGNSSGEDKVSPHSVLNSILWGVGDVPHETLA